MSTFRLSDFPDVASACFQRSTAADQAATHQKIILAARRAPMNQKTPDAATIGIRLYFCSRKFVGQFASHEPRALSNDDEPSIERTANHAARDQ
ncbi:MULTISPECIES: hypothetical protein [Bradyrhizobium]|uniref:hypothetical protein n=1 Tax=Bradyrhizobium TaxID=374 RepID=UPI0012FE0EAB|nr:hypothetical protein [Bradyrhizobium elkanii]WLA81599.1 hypothetical protein QNJ99_40615 [Bradyrhizobium elkanii]